jgi:hypothetical protein
MSSDAKAEPESGVKDDGLAQVVDSLRKKFPDVAEAVIAAHVEAASAPMAGAPIQEYVPVLVEHQVHVHLNERDHDAEAPDTDSDSGTTN